MFDLAFDPSGQFFACNAGHQLQIWRVGEEKPTKALAGYSGGIFDSTFSRLAFFREGRVAVQETRGRKQVRRMGGTKEAIRSLAFSPDASLLAGGNRDWAVQVWDVSSGQEVLYLEGCRGGVESVAFHPNGTILAAGTADKAVVVWDVTSGRMLETLEAPAQVNDLRFSRDGLLLAAGAGGPHLGSGYGSVRLWRLESRLESSTGAPAHAPAHGLQSTSHESHPGDQP